MVTSRFETEITYRSHKVLVFVIFVLLIWFFPWGLVKIIQWTMCNDEATFSENCPYAEASYITISPSFQAASFPHKPLLAAAPH